MTPADAWAWLWAGYTVDVEGQTYGAPWSGERVLARLDWCEESGPGLPQTRWWMVDGMRERVLEAVDLGRGRG